MSKLEKQEENKVKDWCKKHRVLSIKFTPMGERGWPDRLFIFPNGGFHVWIEFKRKGKIPSKLQLYRMSNLMAQGAVAVWFDHAEAAINFLEAILNETMESTPLSTKGNKHTH